MVTDTATHQQEHNGGNGQLINGALQQHDCGDVDAHYRFFRMMCERANEYFVVQKAKGVYATTKHSVGILERTLDNVEGRVAQALQMSAPYYEHYLFPATERLLGYYNHTVENSKTAVERTKSAAVTSGTLGLGLALVATQMGLLATTAATNLFLDGLIATKHAGGAVVAKGVSVEHTAEQQLHAAIEATQALAKNPVEKMHEHANTFLDIANSVFERLLALPTASESAEAGLRERVSHLARRVAGGLSSSANATLVEPCQRQLGALLEQLSKSLVLVDYLKQRKNWTYEKVDQLAASVQDLKARVEAEAKHACTTPETALVRSIRHSSAKLNEQLLKLRVNAAELLTESMRQYLESATAYVEQLDRNFANAEDIYGVKDSVIDEAKQRLHEIAEWSSSLIVRGGGGGGANGAPQNSNSAH